MKRRLARAGGVVTTSLLSVALLAPAGAHAQLDGPFAAEGEGRQLVVDAVNFNALTAEPPVNSLATVGVSPTQAQVATPDGLGEGVLSRGFGQNLDLSVADTQVPLDLSTAEQTAPPDNAEPTVAQLIPLDEASPLLTGSVSESTALARDPAALSCPDEDGRTTVSHGTSTTTDLGVVEIEEGTSLLSVQGAREGTLTSDSGTYIGSNGEVIGEARAQTAEVNLADELRIEVLNPTLTATAPGTPGGASVVYTGEVRVNGEKVAGAQDNQITLEALSDVLVPLDQMVLDEAFGPIDEEVLAQLEGPINEILGPLGITDLTLPDLEELVAEDAIELDELAGIQAVATVTAGQLEDVNEAADGTSASGRVDTVAVELNLVSTLLDTEVPILDVALMPLEASAEAPAGGIDCAGSQDPFANLSKTASAQTVRPGDTFDYDITVPNSAECTVTESTVTDVVSGPSGFSIVGTDPEGTVDGDTVSWSRDQLSPGEQATYTLTVQVPSTAQDGETFDDEVSVTGTCDGNDVTGQFLLPDVPRVVVDQGGAAPDDAPTDTLPTTGGGLAVLGLATLGAAAGLARRR